MAITRTYAVGQSNKVRRLDNHTGPWVDVSIPTAPPDNQSMACLDVMTDPNNPDRVVVVGNRTSGNTGIMVSHDAGVTWFSPSGDWPGSRFYYEVWWVDSDVIWVVGAGGTVVRSTDGGFTFNRTLAKPEGGAFAGTTCIHALSDQVAVVAGSPTNQLSENNVLVYKTVDGGASWTTLNGGLAIQNISGAGSITGPAEGIWISDDEQEIIVSTVFTQNRTTNGGFAFGDFVDVLPEMGGSGRHLTWYPSHGTPTHFRHVGGTDFHINESVDGGATWNITRSTEGIRILGAHFYTAQNGYYTVTGQTFFTTDGGLTGTVSDPGTVTGVDQMFAVWTQTQSELYCLINCEDANVIVQSSNVLLAPHVGRVINATIENWDPQICWRVELCAALQSAPPEPIQDVNVISIDNSFVDCAACLPPEPTDICYDLVSCNGSCDDQLGVQAPFVAPDPLPGSLWTINGDSSCIYRAYPLRQAFFRDLQTEDLSDPVGDFQLGTDDITLEVISLILNGTEYVTSPLITYLLTPGNYSPVECNGLVCNPVAPNTTENGLDNTSSYLNAVFGILNVPLEACPTQPEICPSVIGGDKIGLSSIAKIQYRDGDTFTITLEITNNSGTTTAQLDVLPGNVTLQTNVDTGASLELCNSNVYCPIDLQIAINSVEPFMGECPPFPVPPVLGEPKVIVPRLGEPGFSWKNCDPDKVISIKTQFANSVFAMFKRMRYGIETCCEFDLDKIDVKNLLLDLGRTFDPDLCVDGTPIAEDCCPQPCDASAAIIIPLAAGCPAPVSVLIDLSLGDPILLCPAPTVPVNAQGQALTRAGALAGLTIG